MKKLRAFLAFCVVVNSTISAQTAYTPFIKESAHWEIDEYACDALSTCDPGDPGKYFGDTYHNYYKLQGDTIVDSVIYKKMYKAYWGVCGCPHNTTLSLGSSPYQLYALLREDTIAKKVYWKPTEQGICDNDSLFIDFSHQPTDTFALVCFESPGLTNCFTDTFTIDSVNYSGFENYSVKTNYYFNHARSSWGTIGSTDNLRLFEGIGFSSGFEVEYGTGDGNQLGATLVSYCIGTDSVCPVNFPTAISNITPDNQLIDIYPNPVSGILNFRSSGVQIKQVTVYNVAGQAITQTTKNELDVSSFSAGLYFLTVNTNLGTAHKNFIKQ